MYTCSIAILERKQVLIRNTNININKGVCVDLPHISQRDFGSSIQMETSAQWWARLFVVVVLLFFFFFFCFFVFFLLILEAEPDYFYFTNFLGKIYFLNPLLSHFFLAYPKPQPPPTPTTEDKMVDPLAKKFSTTSI